MTINAGVLVLLAASAFASAGAQRPTGPITPLPCPPNGIDPATIRPSQDVPTPASNDQPPRPVPADVRGHTAVIRLVLDSTGRVLPDSITICGLPNADFTVRLAQVAAKMRFVAADNGAPVAGPTRINWRFP